MYCLIQKRVFDMDARNNIFSWSRFALVYRKEVVEKWKTCLLAFVTVYGIVSFLFIWFGWFFYDNIEVFEVANNRRSLAELPFMTISLMMIVALLLSTILGSFTFRKLRNKQGRIADITLPASQFEKFLVRWINVVVVFNLALVVVYILADATRCIFLRLMFPEITGIDFVSVCKIVSVVAPIKQTLFWISFYFLQQALYILGSVFMPSYSYLKTYIIELVIGIAFLIMVPFSYEIFPRIGGLYPYTGILVVLTIVLWVLAYYRYKKTQVVYHIF